MRTLTINSQDLGNAGTIDTYGTFDGSNVEDQLIEDYSERDYKNYGYDDFEWDYNHDQIVKDLAELRAETLQNDAEIIQSVEVVETGSPRYYNFSTDWADFKITYNEKTVEKYVKEHQEDYDKWYHESGWYTATEWMDKDDYRREHQIANSKLDYYLNHEVYKTWDDAYYPIAEHEWEIYENNITMTLKDNKGE